MSRTAPHCDRSSDAGAGSRRCPGTSSACSTSSTRCKPIGMKTYIRCTLSATFSQGGPWTPTRPRRVSGLRSGGPRRTVSTLPSTRSRRRYRQKIRVRSPASFAGRAERSLAPRAAGGRKRSRAAREDAELQAETLPMIALPRLRARRVVCL